MLDTSTSVSRAWSRASWPTWIGARNDISSIAAVTTGLRQCRVATTAAARSIQCMTVPPSTVPCTLASCGSTSWAISAADSATVRPAAFGPAPVRAGRAGGPIRGFGATARARREDKGDLPGGNAAGIIGIRFGGAQSHRPLEPPPNADGRAPNGSPAAEVPLATSVQDDAAALVRLAGHRHLVEVHPGAHRATAGVAAVPAQLGLPGRVLAVGDRREAAADDVVDRDLHVVTRGQRECDRRLAGHTGRDREAHPRRQFRIHVQCRSEEHTSELQSLRHLVCRLLLEKEK